MRCYGRSLPRAGPGDNPVALLPSPFRARGVKIRGGPGWLDGINESSQVQTGEGGEWETPRALETCSGAPKLDEATTRNRRDNPRRRGRRGLRRGPGWVLDCLGRYL